MVVNYSTAKVLKGEKSIYLAGPTQNKEEWKEEAVQILSKLGFDGIVYVPEPHVNEINVDYNNQVSWEIEALKDSSVIVFWIPSDTKIMPSTNINFGYWISKNKDKVIYGRSKRTEESMYLDWLYENETNIKPINNLKMLLNSAIEMTKEYEQLSFDSIGYQKKLK